jgi:hypothetical protein
MEGLHLELGDIARPFFLSVLTPIPPHPAKDHI